MMRTWRVVPAVLLALGAVAAAGTTPAAAAVVRPFTARYSANVPGDVLLVGSNLLTCPTAAAGCVAARARGPVDLRNNGYDMVRVDIDADPATLVSSSADLVLPPGASILHASLQWGADSSAGTNGSAAPRPADRGKVLLRVPGAAGYAPVTGTVTDSPTSDYQGVADVTAQVTAAGAGTYTVADVQAGTGQDRQAGWALAVAYLDPTAAYRNLTVFDGFAVVRENESVSARVAGFRTPATGGPVDSRIGVVAYEGDGLNTSDRAVLNTTPIGDALSPPDDVFNSTVADLGQYADARNPRDHNTFGLDVDRFDVAGALANGATEATLTVSTGGDTLLLGGVTVATALRSPRVQVTLRVRDVDGGELLPGDLVEYELDVTSPGPGTATDLVLSDVLNALNTYVPGSLRVDGAARTDAADADDTSVTGTRAEVRLGALPAGGTRRVVLQARVDANAASGSVVRNGAEAVFTDPAGNRLTTRSAPTALVVAARPATADLSLTKTGPALVTVPPGRSARATYVLTVRNSGPATARGVELVDTLPAGSTAVAARGATCDLTGPVRCALGDVAAGQSVRVEVDVDIAPGGADPARDEARATAGSGGDPTPDDARASASTDVNVPPAVPPLPQVEVAADGTVTVRVPATDADGDPARVVSVRAPGRGRAVASPDGSGVVYTADGSGYEQELVFTVEDGRGGSVTGTVTVVIGTPAAAPPASPAPPVGTGEPSTAPTAGLTTAPTATAGPAPTRSAVPPAAGPDRGSPGSATGRDTLPVTGLAVGLLALLTAGAVLLVGGGALLRGAGRPARGGSSGLGDGGHGGS